MKEFQSRVVAAWIVALPVAYGFVAQAHAKLAHLRADPQAEVARELHLASGSSFVSLFLATFGLLVLLTLVIDWLGKLIQLLFPEGKQNVKSVERTSPVA